VALLADLLKTKTFTPVGGGGGGDSVPARVRVMLTAEKRVPQLDSLATVIKVGRRCLCIIAFHLCFGGMVMTKRGGGGYIATAEYAGRQSGH